jgi:HK97 family phage major capsid protein
MALISNDDSLGGFLVADDLQAEVLRDLPTFSNLRGICRVIPTSSNVVVFPVMQSASGTAANKYSTGFTGSWKAEGYVTGGTAPTVQNQPRFGQARIPVHVWAPDAVEITPELLGDARADLEGILTSLFAETLALDEEQAFLNGSGVNQPLGLMNTLTDTSVTSVKTADATSLTYEGLIDLFTKLPSQYRKNAKFVMNSVTYGVILKLKDAVGMPLFPVNSTPGQLWGKEIVFSEFMPDVSAGTYPIILGDFSYYGIADRMEMRVQRLVERYAPNIGLLPTAREGGQPLRVNAFRKQLVGA